MLIIIVMSYCIIVKQQLNLICAIKFLGCYNRNRLDEITVPFNRSDEITGPLSTKLNLC